MKYNDNNLKEAPNYILKKVYDTDDNVLFGSSMTKGKVAYNYIPAEHMEDGVDRIVHTSISYDGKGNADLPEDAELMAFEELPKRFTNNEFA